MNQQHYYLHTFRIGSFLLFSSFFELHFKTFKWENMSVYGEYQNDKFSRWILSQLVIPSLISSWALEMHNANPKIKYPYIWETNLWLFSLYFLESKCKCLSILWWAEVRQLHCFYYIQRKASVPLYCFYYINISY